MISLKINWICFFLQKAETYVYAFYIYLLYIHWTNINSGAAKKKNSATLALSSLFRMLLWYTVLDKQSYRWSYVCLSVYWNCATVWRTSSKARGSTYWIMIGEYMAEQSSILSLHIVNIKKYHMLSMLRILPTYRIVRREYTVLEQQSVSSK